MPICILEFMNFVIFNKVHRVQAKNKVQKVRTSQLCLVPYSTANRTVTHGILSLCTRCMTLQFYFVILFHLSHVLHANYFHFNTK